MSVSETQQDVCDILCLWTHTITASRCINICMNTATYVGMFRGVKDPAAEEKRFAKFLKGLFVTLGVQRTTWNLYARGIIDYDTFMSVQQSYRPTF